MNKNNLPTTIPVFPLSNFIIFPKTTVPLNIFEPRYIEMINDSMKTNKLIGMIQPVKMNTGELLSENNKYQKVGCAGRIVSFTETEAQSSLCHYHCSYNYNSRLARWPARAGPAQLENRPAEGQPKASQRPAKGRPNASQRPAKGQSKATQRQAKGQPTGINITPGQWEANGKPQEKQQGRRRQQTDSQHRANA